MSSNIHLLRGTLDLLVLRAVSLEPNHGLGIAGHIGELTRGTFEVKSGSLFPSLHRLEAKGWLRSSWGASANNRRARFYELTESGREQLRAETKNWNRVSIAMSYALRKRDRNPWMKGAPRAPSS